MRRIIIILLALIPLGAAAQNRVIEELAIKYSDRDGFSTTVIKGKLSSGYAGSMGIQGVDISNIMNNITAIIIIRSDYRNDEFILDVNRAIEAISYTTVMSSSGGGESTRLLLFENEVDKSEFVIAITGSSNILMSITGDYTLGKVIKIEN